MFCECKLTTGFSLSEDFDTSNVIDMTAMFHKCVLPDGFSMGPNFNTANVVDMTSMFSFCHAWVIVKFSRKWMINNCGWISIFQLLDNKIEYLLLKISRKLIVLLNTVQDIELT